MGLSHRLDHIRMQLWLCWYVRFTIGVLISWKFCVQALVITTLSVILLYNSQLLPQQKQLQAGKVY